MEPNTPDTFPKMPEPGGIAHLLESSASMTWTLLFFAYSSSSFLSEFPSGYTAVWTLLLVALPITLVALPNILDKRRNAVKNLIFYLLYIIIPAILQLSQTAKKDGLNSLIADFLTALVLWIPLDFNILAKDVSPTGKVTVWGLLTAALSILNLFSVIRPFSSDDNASDLGYTFKLTPLQVGQGIAFALAYVALTVPAAALLRFGRFKTPPRLTPEKEAATFMGMYMSAITEELLFRGVMQNMLEKRLGRYSVIPVIIAAIPYAIMHMRKEKLGFMAPNYRYGCISFLAGCICGLSWRYTTRATASALTRSLGDYVLYRVVLSKITGE